MEGKEERMDDDELDRDIRDLLHHPARESAQDRAIAFAQRRLDRDMEEAARMRRGATRRRVGRVLIATALFILLAAAAATATDSHFLRDLLGKETPLADRIGPISEGKGVTPTIDRFGDPADVEVSDSDWAELVRSASLVSGSSSLMPRAQARVLLKYEDDRSSVTVTAAPTENRFVCYVVSGAFSLRNCAAYFTAKAPLIPSVATTAAGLAAIAGIAANEVESVTVRLDRGRRAALVRNNAFVWIASSSEDIPRSIDAEMADGSHYAVKLASPTAAPPVRPTK